MGNPPGTTTSLPCLAEWERREFFVIFTGLSSPQREMFFCRKGTCHYGRCPIHLIRVGSCLGFRSCCKAWVWYSPRLICSMSRKIYCLPVSLTPRCYWMFGLDIRKKKILCHEDSEAWSRLSSTVLFLLRRAPWSVPSRSIIYGWRCHPCAVPALFDPFTDPEQNIRVWFLQNWAVWVTEGNSVILQGEHRS